MGHYAFVNLRQRIYVSDMNVTNTFQIKLEDVYAIIYKII